MPYDQIQPEKISVLPLAERQNLLRIEQVAADPAAPPPDAGPLATKVHQLADKLVAARKTGASVMLTYGAHLIKNGAGPLLIDLVRHGWVTHLATQGAGIIHDWEFAFLGMSSESVRENAAVGRFGTWDATGRWINLAALVGATRGMGLGESVGRLIVDGGLELHRSNESAAAIDLNETMNRFGLSAGRHDLEHPYAQFSVTAAACECGVPLCVLPGIGYDIFACHPMFHGAAIGRTAATDFHTFCHGVVNLSGGAYLSVGSAIMSPQVFEKAFSVANNLRIGEGQPPIADHHIAVVDLQDGGDWDWAEGEPPAEHPAYYLRFCKSFYRMAQGLEGQADRGTLAYLRADHRVVLANLVAALRDRA